MPWSNRRGFTLIELLIVVVIIGVLAAIAVPKFQNTKGKANAASLRADLRNLVTAEEAYFYDNSAYTTDVTALNIRMTSGVTISFGRRHGRRLVGEGHAPHGMADRMCSFLRLRSGTVAGDHRGPDRLSVGSPRDLPRRRDNRSHAERIESSIAAGMG